MTDVYHDVAVIGRGLIGAAAGRHLAESGHRTVLIGPPEPVDRRLSTGPFSSHPDQGRITRVVGQSRPWSIVAARSIARYADIEARSGIGFHRRQGLVFAPLDLDSWIDHAAGLGSDAHRVDDVAELTALTGIALDPSVPVGFEGPPAGSIDPRALVVAQSRLAAAGGADVIESAVDATRLVDGVVELSGVWGTVRARRVLLATGAFGRELFTALLAGTPRVVRRPRTHLLAETAVRDELPSLILGQPPDERLEGLYWVPPTRYPDGHTYLKIGGSLASDPTITPDELVDWFHGDGDPTEIDALRRSLATLLPDLRVQAWRTTPCVYTGTESEHPMIGWVNDRVAVAIGGNGSAAKSSDELGRLASTLFSPAGWTDDELSQTMFEPDIA